MKPSFPRKEIRILGKLLLVECGILGFGFQNTSRGIRNPTNNWNTEINSTDEKNPKTRTWNLGLIHGAGSLDSLSWGDSFQCGDQKQKDFQSQPVPAVQIVERGRKIQEEKKNQGNQRVPHPRFPGVQLNSLPTYRSALLSERLEQTISEPVQFKEFGRIESLLGGPFAEKCFYLFIQNLLLDLVTFQPDDIVLLT